MATSALRELGFEGQQLFLGWFGGKATAMPDGPGSALECITFPQVIAGQTVMRQRKEQE
jgi:hypothetical protein